MARRCFERLDHDGIAGTTRVLRVLSDTDNVDTQGPVWLVGGKTLCRLRSVRTRARDRRGAPACVASLA